MSPLTATFLLWTGWVISWGVAALWARRTEARAPAIGQIANRIPTAIGGLLLFFGSGVWFGARFHPKWGGAPLWSAPDWLGWLLTGLCAAGLAFAWWARLTLGDLWSGTIARKEGHRIIDTGPYGLVRHPIYTGIIFAAFAFAAQFGALANLIGAGLLAFGFWMRARLEEQFLGAALGEAAYADYRRRTPMLIPFWPTPAP
jgi:protein-S-isoprenylcysteine O-methyltransferase Ste14